MKRSTLSAFCFRWLALHLVFLCQALWAVNLTVAPASIANDYVGKVTLTITGVQPSQSVRVDRLFDLNGNGTVDASTDGLIRGFTVTDGQLPVIGGVRNLNVPGDDDGAVNGQIRVELDVPGTDRIKGILAGKFIYRISDPLNGFKDVTQTFTVTQKPYVQGIRGRITAAEGGSPLGGSFVFLLNARGFALSGTFTDVSGHYEIQSQPGSYLIIPGRPGFIADGTHSAATVMANAFITNNQAMATAAFTISGRVTDRTSGAGIPGLLMMGQSQNNGFSFSTPSDVDGNYSLAASPSQWKINSPGDALAQLGYLRGDKLTVTITTASAANIDSLVTKATALIYGTVRDNLNQPVSGVETRAEIQPDRIFESVGGSLGPNANYTLGVIAGSWSVGTQSDTLPPGYATGSGKQVTLSAGQAAQANLTLNATTSHLLGKVVDAAGIAQPGLRIQAFPLNGGNGPEVVTGNGGNFDLGVTGGAWTLQLSQGDHTPDTLMGPSLTFNVTGGMNISNINYVVRSVTAHVTGVVTDGSGTPPSGLSVHAFTVLNGAQYSRHVRTDAGGHYEFGVLNGIWTVALDCNALTSLGYGCLDSQTREISNRDATVDFRLHLCGTLEVTTLNLPDGLVGNFYSNTLQNNGCEQPYTWSLTPGSLELPPGLSLSSDGAISGTPRVGGTFNFIVRITDATDATTDRSLSLTIYANTRPTLSQPLRISSQQFQMRIDGTVGQRYTVLYSTALTDWAILFVTNAPSASFTVTDESATDGRRFYQLSTP